MANELIDRRYQIIKELGRGSLAAVFQARDTKENLAVALKLMCQQRKDAESILRFKREVDVMSKLSHPNIIKILNCGEHEGASYLVEELVEGESLHEQLKQGKIPLPASLKIISQMTEALGYVHGRGIIHRDLNPKNILISRADSAAKIIDFCLARIIDLAGIAEKEAVVGTFSYMSPEQAGTLPVAPDERSDLYSLGIIFYELAAGELPFQSDNLGSLLHQHIAKLPPSPRKINPEVPEIIENIILKLLKKAPEERYQSAQGLLADLNKVKQLYDQSRADEVFALGADDKIHKLNYHARFIGREAELAGLKDDLRLAAAGQGKLTLVAGSAGMGKTRLVNEVRLYAEEQGLTFISGKCNKYEAVLPYSPFIGAITEYVDGLRRKPEKEKTAAFAAIRSALGELGGALIKIVPALEEVIGKTPPLVPLEPEREQIRFFNVAFSFLEAIAAQNSPIIIFLDDLQWADLGSFNLLRSITPRLSAAHLLLIGGFREDEVPAGHPLAALLSDLKQNGVAFMTHSLAPLLPEQIAQIISETLVRSDKLPEKLPAIIQERAKGNPFFTLQILRSLVEENILFIADNHWRLDSEKIKAVELPSTLIGLLISRIEVMRPGIVDLLSYASIIGRDFDLALLQSITKRSTDDILGILDEALNQMFIWEKPGLIKGIYSFSHDKIREALYEKVEPENRRGLHEQIAGFLEESHPDRLDEVVYELAFHYSRGLDRGKAFDYSLRAGDKAKATYANEEVIRFYEFCLKLYAENGGAPGGQFWMKLKEDIGDAQLLLGRFDSSIVGYETILSFTKTRPGKAKLLEKEGYAYFEKGDLQKAIRLYEAGLKILNVIIPGSFLGVAATLVIQIIIQIGHTFFPFVTSVKRLSGNPDAELKMDLLFRTAYTLYFINTVKCLAVELQGMNIAEHLRPSKLVCQTYNGHGIAMSTIPLFTRALKYQFRALSMARELNEPWNIAHSKNWIGMVYYYMVEWEKALEWLNQAADELTRLGDPLEYTMAYIHLGYVYRNKSDFKQAEKYLRLAYETSSRVKDLRTLGQSLSGLCEVLSIMGEIKPAEDYIAKAIAGSEKASDFLVMAMSLRVKAQIMLGKGEPDKAIEPARQSVKLIERYFFRSDYVVPSYLVLAEALLESPDWKQHLKEAGRASWIGFWLARSYKNYLGCAYRIKAVYACLKGDSRKSRKYFARSIEILEKQNNRYELGKTLAKAGKYYGKRNGTG